MKAITKLRKDVKKVSKNKTSVAIDQSHARTVRGVTRANVKLDKSMSHCSFSLLPQLQLKPSKTGEKVIKTLSVCLQRYHLLNTLAASLQK